MEASAVRVRPVHLPRAAPPVTLLACTECGGEVSSRAAVCPHCGNPVRALRPPPTRSAFIARFVVSVFLALALIALAAIIIPMMGRSLSQTADERLADVHDKVAADAAAQYNIASAQGDKIAKCVQAGFVAAAYLQAQDTQQYNTWKLTEAIDCDHAGVRKFEPPPHNP